MDTRKDHQRTVLLLERHRDCRNATTSLLSVLGYVCIQLESIDQVLEFVSKDCDALPLVLADYRLGDQTGEDLLYRLKTAALSMPVVLMSSQHDDSIREKSINAGAAHFLTKPYVPSELLEVLVRLFDDTDV